jgi:hypothetical protein
MASADKSLLYKSLEELQALAKSYKTTLVKEFIEEELPQYDIAPVSQEEFENIINFLSLAIIKDSQKYEEYESDDSRFFAETLEKYFSSGLNNEDILSLRRFVINYNEKVFDFLYQNIYNYVFGIKNERDITSETFFARLAKSITIRIENLIEQAGTTLGVKTAFEWIGSVANFNADDELEMTLNEFYLSHIKRGKVIEAMIFIFVFSYIENGGVLTENDSTIERNPLVSLLTEDFFIERKYATFDEEEMDHDIIHYHIDDSCFSKLFEESSSVFQIQQFPNALYKRRTLNSFKIENLKDINSPEIIMTIPLYIEEVTGTLSSTGIFVPNPMETPIKKFINFIDNTDFSYISTFNQIELEKIFTNLYNAFMGFMDNLSTLFAVNGDFIYFINNNSNVFLESLLDDIQKESNLFFSKDFIQDFFYGTTLEEEKRRATVLEVNNAKNGQQLTFIDIKGATYSDQTMINEAALLFPDAGIGLFQDPENSLQSTKLTYVVLYKEINSLYRQDILSDIQEYIFARLLEEYGNDFVFKFNRRGITYNNTIDALYRSYKEDDTLLTLDLALNRYKYFYNNIYTSRISDESDLIGYYVAARGSEEIIGKYGIRENERYEIANFLDIYKTSRDYYYKVLLNRSFILEEDYKLYEKLFISFMSIERWLTSKIENLKNFDYYNDEDIKNFLESYGLGVLNQSSFILASTLKDYKLNILRNFNELVRRKGSKDVITSLIRIFDLGDRSIEIKKFLLVDDNQLTNSSTKREFTSVTSIEELDSNSFFMDTLDGNKIYIELNGIDTEVTYEEEVSEDKMELMKYYYDNINDELIYFSKGVSDPVSYELNISYPDITDSAITVEFPAESALANYIISSGTDVLTFGEMVSQSLDLEETDTRTLAIYLKDKDISIDPRELVKSQYGSLSEGSISFSIIIFKDMRIESQGLSFVEVPYESSNLSKDIFNAYTNPKPYADFIKDDPYWTEENVPIQTLKDIGLDAVETKYLSLIMTENIYRKFILSRYLFSSIDFISEKLRPIYTLEEDILSRTIISSGDDVLGDVSISYYFEAIKLVLKSLVRLYEKESNFNILSYTGDPLTTRFHSLNNSPDWTSILNKIQEITQTTNLDITEFSKRDRKIGTGESTSIDWLNINKPNSGITSSDWINYGVGDPSTELLNYQYKKYQESLSKVADTLRYVSFATHKTQQKRNEIQQNSGEYILEILEGLNFIRVPEGTDTWMYFLSKYTDSETSMKIQQMAQRTVDQKELYYKLIEDLIKFPIDYIEGLLTPYYNPEINNNDNFVELSELIFEELYISDQDPLLHDIALFSLNENLDIAKAIEIVQSDFADLPNDEELQDAIVSQTEFFLKLVDGIRTIYSSEPFMQFSFSLRDDEVATLNFVKTAVEIFLSYTAKLYSISYKRIYKTPSESVPLSESIKHVVTAKRLDYYSPDEELTIEEI